MAKVSKIVRGFGCNNGSQEVPRNIHRARMSGRPVETWQGIASADVAFDRVEVMYHEEDEGAIAHRPYLLMTGKITRVVPPDNAPQFPHQVGQVVFGESNAPVLQVRWELSNAEISGLVEKGLMGADSDITPRGVKPTDAEGQATYQEPPVRKGEMEVPKILTSSVFYGLPVNVELNSMEADVNGRMIPVVSCDVVPRTGNKQGNVVTTQQAGYGTGVDLEHDPGLSQYFNKVDMYAPGYDGRGPAAPTFGDDSFDFIVDDTKAIEDATKLAAEKPIVARKVLTPAEEKEAARMTELGAGVQEYVNAHEAGHSADESKQSENFDDPAPAPEEPDYLGIEDAEDEHSVFSVEDATKAALEAEDVSGKGTESASEIGHVVSIPGVDSMTPEQKAKAVEEAQQRHEAASQELVRQNEEDVQAGE